MKKSVEYLTSLYREFGDNAQKALDFIEKNVNEGTDNIEKNSCCDNRVGVGIVAAPSPYSFIKEKICIFDTYKKEIVAKEDVGNHDKDNLEVVVLHQNGAFIVSKHGTKRFRLETKNETNNYISEGCKALFDFDGKKNTELLVKAGLNIELPEGYYMPSLGELVVMRRNIEEVNDCLKLVGGDEFDMGSNYWSSTEYNSSYAWYVYFNSGYVYYNSKNSRSVTRAVAAFTYDV